MRGLLLMLLLAACGGDDDDDDDVPVSDAGGANDAASGSDSPASTCLADPSAGVRDHQCDGITYTVSVPDACAAGPCGLIVDVHGFTMSGAMQDANTNLRALGQQHGYIVVQPNANPEPPGASWTPGADDVKIRAFLDLALETWPVDLARVHFTGFSQGGAMTWRFLCEHGALFASVAPAAEGPQCEGFGAVASDCFQTADRPAAVKLPTLYLHGEMDALVDFTCATANRDAVVAAWGLDTSEVIDSSPGHTRTRYAGADGVPFELVQHVYRAESGILGGHCYPGSTDLEGGLDGQLFPFGCVDEAAFVWGEEVMQFFLDHPKSD